jgi:hypothetical protein
MQLCIVSTIDSLFLFLFLIPDSLLLLFLFIFYHSVQRAIDNWKALKELEKALKVYWSAKDRLPPRVLNFLFFLWNFLKVLSVSFYLIFG